MNSPTGQPLADACGRLLDWLDAQVTVAGRGDGLERSDVAPAATFWLGRLASEAAVQASALGQRGERLDPCAIGVRVLPSGIGPWTFEVTVRCRSWRLDPKGPTPDPRGRWSRSELVERQLPIFVPADSATATFGSSELADGLAKVGTAGLTAEIRVDVETRQGYPELVVQLVNTSPAADVRLADTHLYETQLEVRGLATQPFQLEALPDSFRYMRDVGAYGINVGVDVVPGRPNAFVTTDTIVAETTRPKYWNSSMPEPDLRFLRLAADPLPPLADLLQAFEEFTNDRWSSHALDARAEQGAWPPEMRDEAAHAGVAAQAEVARLRAGLGLLESEPDVLRAFKLMNEAIIHSARGRYDRWRPFQLGFILGCIRFLVDPSAEAPVVDTVWFATGGGKTETYLGLLITTALYDRITGKSSGITAWSRFPLRLLSLQQTQRFADALAGAEIVRRDQGIPGAPFALGFLVGQGGTPNRVLEQSDGASPDPDSPGMPDRYQVLLRCPFCFDESVKMCFDRNLWRLAHQCSNDACPWPQAHLPVYIVDQEVYRYLPTVVVGTLDKAASIGMQAAMRGLVGPPLGICDRAGHGYSYAPRSKSPSGCLVPGCSGGRAALPMHRDRYAPTLRLQDELHLLRDSLGAVDSHYESLLDHLQESLGGPPAKIVASSATLSGHDHQTRVLYRRQGRVFPQPGPTVDDSSGREKAMTPCVAMSLWHHEA